MSERAMGLFKRHRSDKGTEDTGQLQPAAAIDTHGLPYQPRVKGSSNPRSGGGQNDYEATTSSPGGSPRAPASSANLQQATHQQQRSSVASSSSPTRPQSPSVAARLQSMVSSPTSGNDESGPSQSRRGSQQLPPLIIDNSNSTSPGRMSRDLCANRTPTAAMLPSPDTSPQSQNTLQTPRAVVASRSSPEPKEPSPTTHLRSGWPILGRRSNGTSDEHAKAPHGQHHHHPHLSKLRPGHISRRRSSNAQADAQLDTAAAVVASAAAASYVPGAFPVAPSYHPAAHPELQPPRIAFNVLDGPTSRAGGESPGSLVNPPMTETTLPPPRLQRPAIKVKIITWNMGGASLPKGDLEVLLGRVGGYVPPDPDWDESTDEEEGTDKRPHSETRGKGIAGQEDVPRHDRIPPLPHDDGHPYHLLVVAGQECPWGDGKTIATSLGMANELGGVARAKSKVQHKTTGLPKDREAAAAGSELRSPMPVTPGGQIHDGGEFPFVSPPSSSGPTSANFSASGQPQSHGKVFGGKGWSEMCEDWLCRGPAAQTQATKGLAATTEAILHGSVSPKDGDDLSRPTTPLPEDVLFSPTSAGSSPRGPEPKSSGSGPSSSRPLPISGRRGSAQGSLYVPLSSSLRANSSASIHQQLDSTKTSTDKAMASQTNSPSLPLVKDFGSAPAPPDKTVDRQKEKEKARQHLHLQIPGQDNTPHTLGAYELIAKERCAMIYMAVYCWRGARDRVRGVSRGHVKSGLLAGRVGNKGAVGISIKMGRTRLLFVNAHLAAHEGKVQTRLDNIAKIKRELRLDTFLPESDPRNNLEDITACFDQTWWFGDLNFRVDITRQHADWLVMQKRYDQALEFDQLRKVMKDGREFKGFQEHAIEFPPTYKYDVMKTLKKPRREKTVRRILAMRSHSATNVVTSPTDTADDVEAYSPMKRAGSSPRTPGLPAELTDDDDDVSSISSAAWDSFGSSGFAGGQPVTDSEDEDSSAFTGPFGSSAFADPVVTSNTSAATPLFSHGTAIKAKFRIMDLVRSATGQKDQHSSPSSRRSSKRYTRESSVPVTPSPEEKYDNPLEKTTSPRSQPDLRHQGSSTSMRSQRPFTDSPESGTLQSRPEPSRKRTTTGGSSKSGKLPQLHRRSSSAGEMPTDIARSNSVATYDTSAKQRVPSWTDRILWRSNVAREEEQSLTARLGKGIANAVKAASASTKAGHSHLPLLGQRASNNSPSRPHAQQQDSRRGQSHRAGDVAPSLLPRSQTFSHSSSAYPSSPLAAEDSDDDNDEKGFSAKISTPQRKRAPRSSTMSAATQTADGGLNDRRSVSTARPGSRNGVTRDRPRRVGSHSGEINASASGSGNGSPTSEGPRVPPKPKRAASLSSPGATQLSNRIVAMRTVSQPPHSLMGGSPGRSPTASPQASPSLTNADHYSGGSSGSAAATDYLASRSPAPNGNHTHAPTGGSSAPDATSRLPASKGWWTNHIPTLLTAHGAAAAFASLTAPNPRDGSTSGSVGGGASELFRHQAYNPFVDGSSNHAPAPPPKPVLIGPTKGQVECLSYKSLDDSEMRALEGRSDHRPVTWVGLVGI